MQHGQKHLPHDKECYGCNRLFATDSGILIHLEFGSCASGVDFHDIKRWAKECFQSKHYTDSEPGDAHIVAQAAITTSTTSNPCSSTLKVPRVLLGTMDPYRSRGGISSERWLNMKILDPPVPTKRWKPRALSEVTAAYEAVCGTGSATTRVHSMKRCTSGRDVLWEKASIENHSSTKGY